MYIWSELSYTDEKGGVKILTSPDWGRWSAGILIRKFVVSMSSRDQTSEAFFRELREAQRTNESLRAGLKRQYQMQRDLEERLGTLSRLAEVPQDRAERPQKFDDKGVQTSLEPTGNLGSQLGHRIITTGSPLELTRCDNGSQ